MIKQEVQDTRTSPNKLFISAEEQVNHFRGCVYIISKDKVFTEAHGVLDKHRFNTTYGGSIFHLASCEEEQLTRSAWEAFTSSFVNRYPMAHDTCFIPDEPTGAIVDGYVNIFREVKTIQRS